MECKEETENLIGQAIVENGYQGRQPPQREENALRRILDSRVA